jgi:diaminopimelate decarboxylase
LLSEHYRYRQNSLYCEDVALADVAEVVGTPCYIYSSAAIGERFHAYDAAFGSRPHEVCYAVKANGNLAILRLLAGAGAGFDIVSGGELFRVLQAGGDPAKIVFSGVGKTRGEIEEALDAGIFCFNCESWDELALIDALAARLRQKPRIAFRVNPDVDAHTHRHISTGRSVNKFGVDIDGAQELYVRAAGLRNVQVEGVSCHIGSQIFDTADLLAAVDRTLALVCQLRGKGIAMRHLDAGGGLGVPYEPGQETPSVEAFIGDLCRRTEGLDLRLKVEPGRSIVAASGVLLTRVLYRKESPAKKFVIVDASMSELIRPVLYQAYHDIAPVRLGPERGTIRADVVGPVCESGDFLAEDREIANALPHDLLAVCTTGAYGFVQASNYNSRPRPAEVMVEGNRWRVIRQRESYQDLIRGE